MKRLLIVIVVITPLAALLIYGMLRDPNRHDEVKTNVRIAPTFTATLFERYQQSYGGSLGVNEKLIKPMVVNFWASWCRPCYQEAPLLEQAWKEHQDKVLFLGINTQDNSLKEAKKFLDKFQISFPNAQDQRNRIGIDYAVLGLPETFFINTDLSISYSFKGPVTEAILKQEIGKLR